MNAKCDYDFDFPFCNPDSDFLFLNLITVFLKGILPVNFSFVNFKFPSVEILNTDYILYLQIPVFAFRFLLFAFQVSLFAFRFSLFVAGRESLGMNGRNNLKHGDL